MTIDTEIVNRALDIIGHNNISDINAVDPVSVRCQRAFGSELDATLRDHWWNCAKDQRQLPADVAAPLHTWLYSYTIPADALKIRLVDESADWEVQGRHILTDSAAPLNVGIIKRITNYAEIAADLSNAFEYRLAARFAAMFRNDPNLAKGLMSDYLVLVDQAKMNDGQEGRANQWQATGRYRTVRSY